MPMFFKPHRPLRPERKERNVTPILAGLAIQINEEIRIRVNVIRGLNVPYKSGRLHLNPFFICCLIKIVMCVNKILRRVFLLLVPLCKLHFKNPPHAHPLEMVLVRHGIKSSSFQFSMLRLEEGKKPFIEN